MDIGFIEMLLLVIGFYLVFIMVKLNERIKGIRYTLDHISKKIDLPENPISDELRELINDGEDVKVVKKHGKNWVYHWWKANNMWTL